MASPPAVIIPADRPASLGIARSLGQRGISVYAIDANPREIGMASKYVRPLSVPGDGDSEEDRLKVLISLGKRLGKKAVLFPLSDEDVLTCSQARDELHKYYTFVMPPHETISKLLRKDGLDKAASECGVPAPWMCTPADEQEVKSLAASINYPVILKPVISPSWLRPEIVDLLRDNPLSGPPKVALCRDADELLSTYRSIAVYDKRMVIQEVIPGEDPELVYLCFYVDRQSRPLAIFSGRKHRVLPVGFGSASYVRSFRDPNLEEVSLKMLLGTGYQGLGGVEFKMDPRDHIYKIVEFNARFGMWDSLGTRCGVDIPYIAYCDALEVPVEPQLSYREGVIWLDLQRDIRAFLLYRRQGKLSLGEWLCSLNGERQGAIYSRDDWKPAAIATKQLLDRPLASLKRRLSLAS